jgi:hypothetical protein
MSTPNLNLTKALAIDVPDVDTHWNENWDKIDNGFGNLSVFINPKSYGAKLDGVTDDTTAIQNALNAVNDGDTFLLPNGTALVTNLVIPNKMNITLIFQGTLKAKTGGDTDYLLATNNYVNNVNTAGNPIKLVNPKIDGSSLVTNGLVIQTWNTVIEHPEIYNCVNGLKMTAQTKNGTTITSTLVNNTIYNPILRNNSGDGLFVNDPNRNLVTDYKVFLGEVYSNGGDGIGLNSCAGALISGTHLYGNTGWDINVSIGSLGFRMDDVYCEDAQSINFSEFNTGVFVSMNGSTLNGKVKAYASNANAGIKGNGNTFRTSNGQYVQVWGLSTVYSTGDTFESSSPYVAVDGGGTPNVSAPNKFYSKNCVSTGIGVDKVLSGLQTGSNLTQTEDNPSSALVYQSSAQTALTAGTWTKIQFQTKTYDNLSEFDAVTNYRFTAQKTGFYHIASAIGWASQPSGNRTLLSIYKNGAEWLRLSDDTIGGANNSTSSGSVTAKLTAGDYIEVWAYTSNSIAPVAGQTTTYLGVSRIS